MRFKLDANLGIRGQKLLLEHGHDVVTAEEEGLATALDCDLLQACASETRVIITLDLDFANPIRYPPKHYPGIVVLRIPSRGTVADVETALRALLVAAGQLNDLQGELLVADYRGRVRQYQATE